MKELQLITTFYSYYNCSFYLKICSNIYLKFLENIMDGIIQMLPAPLKRFSTHLDFPGQKAAERTFQVILVLSGIIGFFIGFSTQQLSHSIYTVLAGAVLSAIIVLPPWPFLFRKHPIVWQPVCGSHNQKKEAKKSK